MYHQMNTIPLLKSLSLPCFVVMPQMCYLMLNFTYACMCLGKKWLCPVVRLQADPLFWNQLLTSKKKSAKNSLGWYIAWYIDMCFTSRVSCGVLSLILFLG